MRMGKKWKYTVYIMDGLTGDVLHHNSSSLEESATIKEVMQNISSAFEKNIISGDLLRLQVTLQGVRTVADVERDLDEKIDRFLKDGRIITSKYVLFVPKEDAAILQNEAMRIGLNGLRCYNGIRIIAADVNKITMCVEHA